MAHLKAHAHNSNPLLHQRTAAKDFHGLLLQTNLNWHPVAAATTGRVAALAGTGGWSNLSKCNKFTTRCFSFDILTPKNDAGNVCLPDLSLMILLFANETSSIFNGNGLARGNIFMSSAAWPRRSKSRLFSPWTT